MKLRAARKFSPLLALAFDSNKISATAKLTV
jgi:hypothetical protein